ncbi:MAG: hypothetical protein KGD63_07890 [Candidatus Lokiarchaeota archaeon]|nr:hypothetical protein [Candidatus Lokiarchaeota archaeon]
MSQKFLSEKDFEALKESSKWSYVKSLYKIVEDLNIRAEKNCEECEQNMINPHDVNIDFLFEDWRNCSENCDECGEEEKVLMCDLQFQVMNHIANSLSEIRDRQNALAKIFLKKTDKGAKLLADIDKKIKTNDDHNKDLYR